MKKLIKSIVGCLCFVTLLNTCVFASTDDKSDEYNYVDKMFGYAQELYIDESLTKEELFTKALDKYLEENPEAVTEIIKAGFSQIDDYTAFYTASDYEEYYNKINHTFYGIGVIIQLDGDYVKIIRLLDDGSAKAQGLLEGDKIAKVNGVDMKGKSIDVVQSLIVGELDTKVNITVLRNSEEITFELTRRPVNDSTVSHIVLEDGIAYVSIINFAMNTANEFSETLADLELQGVDKIVLDLRNNPGGYLVSAVEIAKMIVPKGVIVQTMFRQSENNYVYYSNLENPKFKFSVLVNEQTASASEILTSALQDSKIGTVFGDTTYGKGLIQDVFNLRDSNSIKITTGRYLTRNGREINSIGIEPDYFVPNTTEPIDYTKYPLIDYNSPSGFSQVNDNIPVIKERLRLIGYNINNTDNIFDEDLEAAVLDFQIKKNLTPTGTLDRITMVQIENAFAEVEVLVDNQLYRAYEHLGGKKEDLDRILFNK